MAKARPESDLPRTLEEFDRWHARQPERWEFIAGHAVMMAPGRNRHSIIKGNVYRYLANALDGKPCRPIVDGPEVKSVGLSAIPDVVVTCSPVDLEVGRIDEPVLIVEVTSPSSERDDTERKWQRYCLIESLKHYMVVASESRFVILHTRAGPFEWAERVVQDGGIVLDAIGASLTMDEIYDSVSFDD